MVEIEVNELAIIFEPSKDEEGLLSFVPTQVVEGSYDEDSERFVDTNLYSYPHLTNCERSRGYALREPISKLSLKYPDKSLEEIKNILLEEHKKHEYFLGIYRDEIFLFRNEKENNENFFVIDEDIEESMMCLFEDEELIDLMLKHSGDKTEISEEYDEEVLEEKEPVKTNINPHLLYKQIKETVKGQDGAIKKIVATIWENYNSDHAKNLILVGPSGTGKTEILRQISKKINVPLLITGVTGMSQAGYVGTGTDEILKNLLTLTKGDVEKAEHAIVVLDEIDKLAYGGAESGKISTDGVQNELLKIVEDGDFFVEFTKNGMPAREKINTSNITFIGVGAFNGMLTTRTEKRMGFGNDISSKEIKKEKIVPEDLITYGLKPELVGRMGSIVKLNDLDLTTMKDIIKNSKKSAYSSKIKFLNNRGIKLAEGLEEEVIEEIAKIAISKKIGARAITGIVEEMFSDIIFEIADPECSYNELEITKETVSDCKKYILRK